jgi:hypothetical protein
MPPFLAIFGLLIPAVQICCALHAYNRGKDRFWFFVILIFPVLGSAIYFFTEVVPELRRTGQLQQWVEKIPWLFGREIERLEEKYSDVPTTQNAIELASAHVRDGNFTRAIQLYRESLKEHHQNDDSILRLLAEALTEKKDWEGLIDVAIDLRRLLKGSEINDAIRWEAIALDGLDRFEEAEPRYLHVIDHCGSEEMRFRLALMLTRQDRATEARDHFETLKSNIRRGNSDYRRKNRKWGNLTKEWLIYLDKKQTTHKKN